MIFSGIRQFRRESLVLGSGVFFFLATVITMAKFDLPGEHSAEPTASENQALEKETLGENDGYRFH